jgi:hypothetical protein
VHGLSATPYQRDFLRQLAPNAGLIAAAEAYRILLPEIAEILASATQPPRAAPIA